jgi:hypothetical protein
MSIGAIAAHKTNLNANYTVTVSQDSGTIATKESLKTNYFTIPSIYGGGFQLSIKTSLGSAQIIKNNYGAIFNIKNLIMNSSIALAFRVELNIRINFGIKVFRLKNIIYRPVVTTITLI